MVVRLNLQIQAWARVSIGDAFFPLYFLSTDSDSSALLVALSKEGRKEEGRIIFKVFEKDRRIVGQWCYILAVALLSHCLAVV